MGGIVTFQPRLAAASLSGKSDADWARTAAPYVGCAFLGGIALDDTTRAAARQLVDRDRNEFLPPDPVAFIHEQLQAISSLSVRSGFNVRSATPGPIRAAGSVCASHDAILEINAHCRQDEMCAAGAGESLLTDRERLREQVRSAATSGATVSVKVRTEVPGVDLPALCASLADSGADMIHVDAMDSESVVADIVSRTPDTFVIANNGVRDRATTWEYLDYGADAVSVGRPSDDPSILKRVQRAVEAYPGDRRYRDKTGDTVDA